jgi:hypothetical protein
MKTRSFTFIFISSIFLCGFITRTNAVQDETSISKAVGLIKKYVSNDAMEVINLEIINTHNSKYTITSSLWSGLDSVKLYTHIIDMTGGQRDTVLNLPKQIFLFKLDRASYPINSLKLAGHHQTISVKKGEMEEVFRTYDGRALMNLLEYGE